MIALVGADAVTGYLLVELLPSKSSSDAFLGLERTVASVHQHCAWGGTGPG